MCAQYVTEPERSSNRSAESGDGTCERQLTNRAQRKKRLGGRSTEYKKTIWDWKTGFLVPNMFPDI